MGCKGETSNPLHLWNTYLKFSNQNSTLKGKKAVAILLGSNPTQLKRQHKKAKISLTTPTCTQFISYIVVPVYIHGWIVDLDWAEIESSCVEIETQSTWVGSINVWVELRLNAHPQSNYRYPLPPTPLKKPQQHPLMICNHAKYITVSWTPKKHSLT